MTSPNSENKSVSIITPVEEERNKMATIELSIRVEPATKSGADIVFAIDCSPSMQLVDEKQLRITAIKNFLDLLESARDSVRISVLFWSDKIVDSMDLSDNFEEVRSKLDKVPEDIEVSATDFNMAIKSAEMILDKSSRANMPNVSRGIVLISDVLPDSQFKYNKSYIESVSKKNYKIYTVGIKPHNHGVPILKEMANLTEGCYVRTDKDQDLCPIFKDLTKIVPHELLTTDAKLIVKLPSNIKTSDPLEYSTKVPYEYMNKNIKVIEYKRNSEDGALDITWSLGALVASNDPLTLNLRANFELESNRPEIKSILRFKNNTVVETSAYMSDATIYTVKGPTIRFAQKIVILD